eukprot:UN23421
MRIVNPTGYSLPFHIERNQIAFTEKSLKTINVFFPHQSVAPGTGDPEITVNQIHLIIFASCRTNVDPPPKNGLRLSRKIIDFSPVAFKVESYQPSRSFENT